VVTRVEEGDEEVLRLEVAVRHTVVVAKLEHKYLCFKGRKKR